MKIVKKMSNLFVSTLKKIQKCNPIIQVVIYAVMFMGVKLVLDTLMNGNIFSEGFTGQGKEMVLFHMNGCGHCKKMMPEWEKFETMYSGKIGVGRVEKDQAPEFVKKLGVKGFPTIMLLDEKDQKIEDYSGERKADAFMNFLKNKE